MASTDEMHANSRCVRFLSRCVPPQKNIQLMLYNLYFKDASSSNAKSWIGSSHARAIICEQRFLTKKGFLLFANSRMQKLSKRQNRQHHQLVSIVGWRADSSESLMGNTHARDMRENCFIDIVSLHPTGQ